MIFKSFKFSIINISLNFRYKPIFAKKLCVFKILTRNKYVSILGKHIDVYMRNGSRGWKRERSYVGNQGIMGNVSQKVTPTWSIKIHPYI